jgi:SnoaL-like domain
VRGLGPASVAPVSGTPARVSTGITTALTVASRQRRAVPDHPVEIASPKADEGAAMVLTTREVAEAFSGHRSEAAFPSLSARVSWSMPGSDGLEGREAVVAACRATEAALADTEIEVERFVVVDGGDVVAVDTLTGYRVGDDVSTVASCDVYEFRDGMIEQITSYTVEV